MDEFMKRLINEREELEEKLNKLDIFIGSEKFDSIDQIQQTLLKIQSSAMETYYKCLDQRIAWLTRPTDQSADKVEG